MFDPRLIAAQLDGRVLAASLTLPDSATMEAVAAAARTDMAGLRCSMRRLALRQPGKTWPWAAVSACDMPPWLWAAERLAEVV